jgi:beta-phosphoglucomutase-like phosphatase (HAD superfamily)
MAMRAVLFDFDGVLVNSEPLHFEALRDCLRPEGIEIELGEYLQQYLAYDDWGAIRRAMERHGSLRTRRGSGPLPSARR